jgi:hypothetical protein
MDQVGADYRAVDHGRAPPVLIETTTQGCTKYESALQCSQLVKH